MRLGAHSAQIAPSLADADAVVFLHRPELPWDAEAVVSALKGEGRTAASVDALINAIVGKVRAGDHVVFMSNGGFEDAPRRCLIALQS
jgi:UDP-N-acetylmuramate: L-alanyl-gamma-D-glutamyl-meso-diaminopimelate ligase